MKRLWWSLKWWMGFRVLKSTDAEAQYHIHRLHQRQQEISERRQRAERAMKILLARVDIIRRRGEGEDAAR